MKALEKIIITAAFIATLMLPFLPMGWKSMAPGYILWAAAAAESLGSAGMACIALGFAVVVASLVFAFATRWGIAAASGIVGLCIFGVTALLQLLYFKNPVGSGLWLLLIILIIHSFLSVKWYLQNRPTRQQVA